MIWSIPSIGGGGIDYGLWSNRLMIELANRRISRPPAEDMVG